MESRLVKQLRQQKNRADRRAKLEARWGGVCCWAGCEKSSKLEFAHLEPTKCTGKGRGQNERLKDIEDHPNHYTLLCREHHRGYDKGKATLNLKLERRRAC